MNPKTQCTCRSSPAGVWGDHGNYCPVYIDGRTRQDAALTTVADFSDMVLGDGLRYVVLWHEQGGGNWKCSRAFILKADAERMVGKLYLSDKKISTATIQPIGVEIETCKYVA